MIYQVNRKQRHREYFFLPIMVVVQLSLFKYSSPLLVFLVLSDRLAYRTAQRSQQQQATTTANNHPKWLVLYIPLLLLLFYCELLLVLVLVLLLLLYPVLPRRPKNPSNRITARYVRYVPLRRAVKDCTLLQRFDWADSLILIVMQRATIHG